jgi:aminoglycoside phosphotransferase (APT) family kinase protein
MHADELDIDVALVRRLLATQFPRWAGLSVARVESSGTDNAIFRLGDDLVVRMPRIRAAVPQVEKEQRWLPRLAPHLPLEIPAPLAKGDPGEGYPWPWSVYRWIEGETATLDRIANPVDAAITLAEFVSALHRVDSTGAPAPGRHNFFRGLPLVARDPYTRQAIAALEGMLDTAAVTAEWEAALRAPAWSGAPVWIHGDLAPGNLIAAAGALRGVIDFGGLGAGDPACDLIVAWNLFTAESREGFRAAMSVDAATWARGRGWALSIALIQLPYYKDSNPRLAASARRTIAELLANQSSEARV